jgi:transposase
VRVGESYAERWKVKRIFTWLASFQRLSVGHERYLFTFWDFSLVAFVRMSLRRF